MKLAVIGSRNFTNYQVVQQHLQTFVDQTTLVVSGGAKGADSLAEQWAKQNNIPTKIFYPDWNKHGRAAGPIRNKLIIQECDQVVAFWDGKSTGTAHSIGLCKSLGKQVQIHLI